MTRRDWLLICAGLACGAWNWPFDNDDRRQELIVAGSSRMLGYNLALADAFAKSRDGIDMVVEGGGAYPALLALRRRSIDILAIHRELGRKEDDPHYKIHAIARDAVAVIVHPHNRVTALTHRDVREIFEGQVQNWGMFGGTDSAITVLDREGGDPADRMEMTSVVLGHGDRFKNVARYVTSNEEMIAAVAEDVDAIGYCGWEDVTPAVRALSIDATPLTRETIVSGRYRFSWPYYYVTNGATAPAVADFIAFTKTAAARSIMNRMGLIATT